ncbi:MAG TPA: hypothetical protein VHM02_13805, partial [Thermoanaerobaculia bacterium]|nr:hypothetical protein [Thermoanaerobaculia bacterium]
MSPFRRLRGEEPPPGLPDVRVDAATGEPEPFWRYALRSLGGVAGRLVVGRMALLFALPWLVFGGMFLSGAWQMGAGAVAERERRAALTGRGEAVVEASWWRIDFDPAPLGDDGTNWRDLARRELCSRFRFVSADDGPAAVACRRFHGLADGRELLADGDPELPVRWVDAAGRPALDLRLSPRADAWLAARPASWWPLVPQDDAMRARHRPGSELDALLIEADAPAELLLAAWDPAAAAAVAMAFDPERPARAVPLAALAPRRAPPGEPPLLPIFAVVGLLLWSVGCTALTAGARRWVRAALIAGTLLLLPWWGSHLHRALGLLWQPAGGLASFLGPELAPVWGSVEPRPEGGEVAGERGCERG